MQFKDFLQRLFAKGGTTGEMSLEHCRQLRVVLGKPDQYYKIIHVAGTNGKGTVCTKLANCLQKQGYKTGLFTSPHISSFRERIRINGEMIPEKAMIAIGSAILDLSEEKTVPTTFFEVTTLLALLYFKKQNVDWVVLETGLGGRLDATNIVTPEICVITSISKDHTHVLGNTIEEIATEKAGIIKHNIPVVIGPTVPVDVIARIAKEKEAPLHIVREQENANTIIAKKVLEVLKIPADKVGLKSHPPCRFEQLAEGDIILDVAHNPEGLRYLFKQIESLPNKKPLRILFGLSLMKDVDGCIAVINGYGKHFHVVSDGENHCVSANLIAEKMHNCSVHNNIINGVQEAVTHAKNNDERLIICGSFYVMKDAKLALGVQEPRDTLFSNKDWQEAKSGNDSFT